MSESKKTSSPYAVLENRSLDQWKVTELKEELKRRKLTTKGLKDDLVRRLDEAVRAEVEEPNENHDNGVNDIISHPSDDATIEPLVAEKKTTSITYDSIANNESLAEDNKITEKFDINESLENNNLAEKIVTDDENLKKDSLAEKLDNNDQSSKEQNKTENCVVSLENRDLENVEINNEEKVSNLQAEEEVKPNSSSIGDQVDEVSQVKSDSISIDTMSITEKNELKDNVIITDDVKLELDVKPEMVHPSSSSKLVLDGGAKTESVVSDEEKDVNNGESVNICKKIDSEDVGSPEKLNLDRSSGDDSMEEDALESKQIDLKFSSEDIGDDVSKKTEVTLVKEDEVVDVMVEDTPAAKITESIKENSDPSAVLTKRKLHDQEAVANSEVVKRQRRWNSEGLKVPPEQQHTTNPSVSTTPKDAMFQGSMKHSFSRSNSSVSHEEPKERVVPPLSKAPTTSLRIDRFLRPFTLKAVQELLGKTGTVVSFWMDHIKTHCYVTYSSVEEAVETRNAVYNLQWPANGGRLLVAEFVDPLEVKTRTEVPPPPSPLTPANATTPALLPQPPQQLPPPPPLLPPPPPLSFPPQLREPALPPPPPLHEKTDPPIVTLDDLFRKTRATPRIYYLPLSDDQVAAKGQGKAAAKQSAGEIAFRKERQRSAFRDRFRCFLGTRNLTSWIGTNICSIYFSDIESLSLKTLSSMFEIIFFVCLMEFRGVASYSLSSKVFFLLDYFSSFKNLII